MTMQMFLRLVCVVSVSFGVGLESCIGCARFGEYAYNDLHDDSIWNEEVSPSHDG